jgi:hypothetical protein
MRLTVVISPALAAPVGGDAGGSLTSLIDAKGRAGAAGRGSVINGDLRSTAAAAAGQRTAVCGDLVKRAGLAKERA